MSPGWFEALAAALLFGLAAPLSKLWLGSLAPLVAAGLLYFGAGSVLGLAWLLTRHASREAPLRSDDLPWLGWVILCGGFLGPWLLLVGLREASGTTASLLLNLEAVFTVLLAVAFGEALDRRVALACGLILLGALVLGFDPATVGSASMRGALAIAGACAAWALDNNLSRRLAERDPLAIAALKGLGAGTLALGLGRAWGMAWPDGSTWGVALGLGTLGYGLSLILFMRALRALGTARTGALFATAPFAGGVAAIVLLHEAPSWRTGVAAVTMGLGVLLMLRERHAHLHRHHELEHEHVHRHDDHHQHPHEDLDGSEPHSHRHRHAVLEHTHPHQPDPHHRHGHSP